MKESLKETEFLDFKNPEMDAFVEGFESFQTDKEIAVAVYNKVRDHFLYDPFHLDLRPEALKASVILTKKRAWCVEKAIVMAAALRSLGIPSKLGYGIVVNHVGVLKLLQYLKRPEIVFHGFVAVYLNGNWVKATPAFDPLVCKLAKVELLNWDGESDAMFQAFQGDKKFMEYKHMYGVFDDVPVDLMNSEMKKYYPHLFEEDYNTKQFSFFHQ